MKNIDHEKINADFGRFIKDGRINKGISQKELADLLDVGQSYISLLEKGKRNVVFAIAVNICRQLELDISDFTDKYMNVGPSE